MHNIYRELANQDVETILKTYGHTYVYLSEALLPTYILFRYVELHNIYRERANQDVETILKTVQQIIESNNISR